MKRVWALTVAVTAALVTSCASTGNHASEQIRGVSGPVAWEVVDIRQRVPADGSEIRWYYTLVMKETAGRAIQFERRQHGAYGSGVEGIPGEEGFKQRINANSELRMSQVQRLSGDAVRRFGASPFTVFERYYGKDDAGNPVTVSVRIPLSASVGKRMPQSIAALAALPPVKPLQPEDLKSLAGTWRGYYRDDKGFEVPLEMAIKEDGSFEAAEDEPVTNRFRGRLSIRDGQIGYSQQNDTGSLSLYEGEGKRIIQGHVGGPREDLPGQPGRATYKVNYLFRLERTQ